MTTTQQAPPTQPSKPSRRRSVPTIATVVGMLLIATAGLAVLSWLFRSSDRQVQTFDENVTAIEIDGEAGGISLRATDSSTVTLTTTRRWSLGREPDVTATVEDDALRVTTRCRGPLFFLGLCSAAQSVEVPHGVTVTAESSAGRIDAEGLTAGLTAETSAGGITLTGVSGDIDVRTSAGGIDAAIASERVRAVTSAGGITISNSEVPEQLTATTSAGGIDIAVPRAVYRVEAESSAGDVEIAVPTDPVAPRRITATSSAGAVRLRQIDD